MSGAHDQELDGESDEGGFSLQDALAILRRRYRLIAVVTMLVGNIAAGVSLLIPNKYTAVATVQMDQRSKKIVNIEGVISDLKPDTPTVDSEVEIIRSKAIAQRVIEKLGLRTDEELVKRSGVKGIASWLGISRKRLPTVLGGGDDEDDKRASSIAELLNIDTAKSGSPERDEIARAFESRLKVVRVRNTLLIEIHYTSGDPTKAARIANSIADVYLQSQIEQKERATEQASQLLEERIVGLRERVGEAERRIERFRSDNNIFDADGFLLVDRQLAREMETLVVARKQTAESKARYELARRMMLQGEGQDSVADVLQSQTVRLLRDELTKAMRKEAELATKYGARHPEMQKIAADVAKAQGELTAEVNKIIRNLKTEFEVATDRERQLTASLETLKGQISASKDKIWQLKDLEREANSSKQLYEALLQRNKQTVETLGLQLPDARVVERADIPPYPASPKRKQIVLIALAGGLALGLGLAFLIELMAPGIVKPEDAERALDVPLLAALPGLKRKSDGMIDPLMAIRLMVAHPRGIFAEAIRGLRHEIDARRTGPGARVLLVASALPNEGKTIVASNIAHHYAQTGSRVLLIDADLRKAELTGLLGLAGRTGIADTLMGAGPVELAIVRDSVSQLNVLPAARAPGDEVSAAELLSGRHTRNLLAYLREQFDLIVIDAPPILPVVDARIAADLADQIVFVMAWKATPKQLAKKALKLLGSNNRKVVGVVVNQVDPAEMPSSQGYGRTTPEPAPLRREPRLAAA
jgi:exopolysaccharide transport family protein